MTFDWSEFLTLARTLTGTHGINREAADRSAVSRAYYAAFCSARNYAEARLGFQARHTAEDHGLLREHLARLDNDWPRLAEILDELRKWRNRCDYDDFVANLQILTNAALQNAEEAVRKVKQ